jgi:hypothetical protein
MFGIAQAVERSKEDGCAAPESGPLIGLRVSAGRSLWRLGPGWAVLAGALAGGVPLLAGDALLRLAGAIVLADPVWGAVWVPVAGCGPRWIVAPWGHRDREREYWLLPYLQPVAPAARLRAMLPEARWHNILVAALLMAGLGALLGLPALLLSLVALLVTFWALFGVQWDIQPALPRALLAVGLPWLVGMTLGQGAQPLLTGSAPAVPSLSAAGLVLGAAFTLLEWGSQRACSSCDSRARGVWTGELAIVLALVALRLPWTTAVVAVLLLPPAWYCLRAGRLAPPISRDAGPKGAVVQAALTTAQRAAMLARSGPWWWAAMMLVALSLRL